MKRSLLLVASFVLFAGCEGGKPSATDAVANEVEAIVQAADNPDEVSRVAAIRKKLGENEDLTAEEVAFLKGLASGPTASQARAILTLSAAVTRDKFPVDDFVQWAIENGRKSSPTSAGLFVNGLTLALGEPGQLSAGMKSKAAIVDGDHKKPGKLTPGEREFAEAVLREESPVSRRGLGPWLVAKPEPDAESVAWASKLIQAEIQRSEGNTKRYWESVLQIWQGREKKG